MCGEGAVACAGSDVLEGFADVACRIGIDWDSIRDVKDRVAVTVEFILLVLTFAMVLYETVGNERFCRIEPLECGGLTPSKLADLFEKLVSGSGYGELDAGFIEVLRRVPACA